MGGLAAASLLAQDGHQVRLFERFETARPLGSGLVIQPVGLAVLDAAGAGEDARRLGAPLLKMEGFAGRRKVLDVAYRARAPGLAMHRAALFHALFAAVERLGKVEIATGAEVVAAPAEGERRLIALADGTRVGPFDLVVDASGSRSVLSPLQARPLAFGAVWGHVPWPENSPLPTNQLSQHYQRAERMAGVLPIGCLPGDQTPRAAVFWSLPQAALQRWESQDMTVWQSEVVDLWPEMGPFVAGLTRPEDMTVARYAHGTLRQPYAAGLAFLGDAAHRASPQLGQGANMALLDALALALALRTLPLADALPRYARMRRWHVRIYQAISAAFTPMYQSSSRVLPRVRDHLLTPASRLPPVQRVLTALVSGDMIPPLAGERFPGP